MYPTVTEDCPLLTGQSSGGGGGSHVDANKVGLFVYLMTFASAIGGLLFGYDTGIISGALIFVRDEFQLNEWWQEAVVSSALLSAWFSSILAGSLTDTYGRRPAIILSSILLIVGSLLMGAAHDKIVLLLGRLVVGAAVGLASMVVPMYIAEIAPSGVRGQLVMINMCCITGGQFMASLTAYGFSFMHASVGWRYMLGVAAVFALVQFIAFMFLPESPRWLVSRGRLDAARHALRRMRPRSVDIEAELESIHANDARSKRQQHERLEKSASLRRASAHSNDVACLIVTTEPQESTWKRVWNTQPVRKALLVGCALQLVQQVSGINTVMYYSASIFEMAGVASKQQALVMSAVTAFVNFIFTLVGFALVERVGRRPLVLVSLAGVTLSLITLGAGFQFANNNSPVVTTSDLTELNAPCGTLSDCSSCVANTLCGFCFGTDPSTSFMQIQEATCLHVNNTAHDRSLLGACTLGSDVSSSPTNNATLEHIWAYEWCPSKYAWLTLVGMIAYLMSFAPGMGPMPWTVNSEIYPLWARGFCLSCSTSVCWLANLLVSMTFLSLSQAITSQGAFYLYASCAAAGLVVFSIFLPETRGKTLEQLEGLFASDNWRAQHPANEEDDEKQQDKSAAAAAAAKRRNYVDC